MASYGITQYGALADGSTINTAAIQTAINACAENGGGSVVIPPGIFVSGTLEMKSHVTLYLEPGAVLRGSSDLNDYRANGFQHNELGETISLIYALNQTHLRITGEGTIDLNGSSFMDFSQLHMVSEQEEAQMNAVQRKEAVVKYGHRPTQPIFFHNCQYVQVDGITVRESPCWTITFSDSRDIKVHHLTIDNNLQISNCDGIHLSACQDAIVHDCILSCADDCVAITCITDWDGISERIIVSRCIMRTRSAGVRIGHLSSKVRNILISDLVLYESNRGIGIFAGDDGWVKNVRISNLIMDTRIYAGGWWGKGEPLMICAVGTSGAIENISVNEVQASAENGVLMVGEQDRIRSITLKNWRITLKRGHNRPLYDGFLDLRPAPVRTLPTGKIPWLYADHVSGLTLENIRFGADPQEDADLDTQAEILNEQAVEQTNVRPI